MIYSLNNFQNESFEFLLSNSIDKLHSLSKKDTSYFKTRKGIKLEKDVFQVMCDLSKNTDFENTIELVSGQRFPDIVSFINEKHGLGVEVKTSTQNHWKTTGSSIFEGTRIADIDRIYLLYGKLADPVEFRFRKYEECLYNVAVTHSPRYLIDMETKPEESIFDIIGIDYEQFRNLKNPFLPIRQHFKRTLCKPGDDVWWIDSENRQETDIIRLWRNLDFSDQTLLINQAMAFFPQIFGNRNDKFSAVATWLVAEHNVVNPSLRDVFTAGGQKNIQLKSRTINVARIIKHLADNYLDILKIINNSDDDKLSYYWNIDPDFSNKSNIWKQLVNKHNDSTITDLLDEEYGA
ncbi:MAG: hypothetical protein PF588_07525 [Candidatus Kapabacteria bacterium]|nr:hypothetical protein [Candidatus Kapabacteria bacterium]